LTNGYIAALGKGFSTTRQTRAAHGIGTATSAAGLFL